MPKRAQQRGARTVGYQKHGKALPCDGDSRVTKGRTRCHTFGRSPFVRLFADAELANDVAVSIRIALLKVVQQTTALAN